MGRSDAMLIVMGLLLTAAIICTALTSGGSEKAINRAADKMWEYIDSRYADIRVKNHGEKPVCTGAFSYSLLVSDSDCEDIYFYVVYTNGNISDDYNHRVTKLTNTFLRLEEEMGEHYRVLLTASGSDISDALVTLPPRVRNDIPDSIYTGVKFDPTHPIFRGSTLTLLCSATDDMEYAAHLIKKAHAIAEENGTVFSQYCLYGTESGEAYSLEIEGVTPETAESERLSEILRNALSGKTDASASDISVGVYG